MMAQLTCQNLCVGYDGKSVLQALDFEVFAGDYLCIVGENGSGKSNLIDAIEELRRFDNEKLFPYIESLFTQLETLVKPSPLIF